MAWSGSLDNLPNKSLHPTLNSVEVSPFSGMDLFSSFQLSL